MSIIIVNERKKRKFSRANFAYVYAHRLIVYVSVTLVLWNSAL